MKATRTAENWKKEVLTKYSEISNCNIGLRSLADDENYNIGDYARKSLDWDAENDCSSDSELNGTCAIAVNDMWLDGPEDLIARIEETVPEMETYYRGKRIVLLCGTDYEQGTDPGEHIIINAKVLAIIS